MTDLEIADATPETLDAVCDLARAYYAEMERIDPVFKMHADWREKYRDLLRIGMERDNYWIRLASLKDAAAGFVMFGASDEPIWQLSRRGYLFDLFVLPEHRRRRVGTALAQNALATLTESGCERVDLTTLIADDKSNRFWRSFGFRPWMSRLSLSL